MRSSVTVPQNLTARNCQGLLLLGGMARPGGTLTPPLVENLHPEAGPGHLQAGVGLCRGWRLLEGVTRWGS